MKDWWEELSSNPVNFKGLEERKEVKVTELEGKDGELSHFIITYFILGSEVVDFNYWPLVPDMKDSVRDYIRSLEGI